MLPKADFPVHWKTAARLRGFLRHHEVSVEEIAGAMGVFPFVVWFILDGWLLPTAEEKRALAQYLRVDPAFFSERSSDNGRATERRSS